MKMQSFETTEEMVSFLEENQRAMVASMDDPRNRDLMAELPPGAWFLRWLDEEAWPTGGLLIAGEVLDPQDPHDRREVRAARKRGLLFARCYSVVVPEGEMGSTHVTNVARVARPEEIEWLRKRGWKPLVLRPVGAHDGTRPRQTVLVVSRETEQEWIACPVENLVCPLLTYPKSVWEPVDEDLP